MSKFFQRSWFLVLGTWTSFSRAMPQDKISINQSINPSRESIISTQKDALRFLLYQRHGISNIPPIFYPAIAPKNVPTKPQRLPDLLPARRPRQSTPSLSFLPSSLLSFILPPPRSRPLPRVPHHPPPPPHPKLNPTGTLPHSTKTPARPTNNTGPENHLRRRRGGREDEGGV